VLCWPVVDPLHRYRYAHEMRDKGNKHGEEWIKSHDAFWKGEDEMAEGNPKLLLERGEKTPTPTLLYIQGTADIAHPVVSRDGFIESYRKAGGKVELHLFEDVGEAFITSNATSPQAVGALEKIVQFVHKELGAK
jgi:acetyl esterase